MMNWNTPYSCSSQAFDFSNGHKRHRQDDDRSEICNVPFFPKKARVTTTSSSSPMPVLFEKTQDCATICETRLNHSSSPPSRLMNLVSSASTNKEKRVLEWWTKKPCTGNQNANGPTRQCCFICERELTVTTTLVQQLPNFSACAIMPENALLHYFKPINDRKPAAKSTHAIPSADAACDEQSRGGCRCSFCERHTCIDCISDCEECGDSFCSFCRTVDYNGNGDRTLCLDCYSMRRQAVDDAMQID